MYSARSIINLLAILLLGCIFLFHLSPLFAAEQANLSVTANVGPQPRDYQLSLSAANQESIIPQDTTINYVITYGASSSAVFASPATIVADWKSSDAASGVHILDYVAGSANKAYGNTSPVVDLQNRTITWDISSLPVGTMDQQVSFDLKTNLNYIGPNDIRFTVRANMSNNYTTMPEQSISKTYRYNPNAVTTTPPPPTTPVTSPETPTQTSGPRITNVSFTGITAETATIMVDTNTPTKVKVMYGTSSKSLSQSLTTGDYSLRSKLTIDGLSPAKTYYVRIIVTDRDGHESTSEIFTFQTAEKSTPPDLADNIIVVTSGGNILLSDIQGQNGASLIALLTPDSNYELNYAIRKKISMRSIDAVVRNKVLGITNLAYANEPQTLTIPMTEKSPSTYFASLKTLTPGLFEVSVRIVDTHGNVIEQKVAELKVMSYLSIFEEGNEQPIADSRVFFYYYNRLSGRYEPLAREIFNSIPNPSYSTINGAVKINLPPGKYQTVASAFGYAQKRVDFVLGPNAGEDFPKIFLRKDPTNIFNYIDYYLSALSDISSNMQTAVNDIALSVRFFNLLATFILLVTIGVTYVFFSLRTRVYLRHLFPYFTHHMRRLTRSQPLGTFCAIITDEQGRRLQGALISVLDDTTGELLTSIASNTVGICYLFNPKAHKNLKLLIIKQGYMPKTVAVESDIMDTANGLTIMLKKGHRPTSPILTNTWLLTEVIAGRFFEISLFTSFILELFFLSIYGWSKTLPFFALSFFNLILWILYQKEKQERKVFKKS